MKTKQTFPDIGPDPLQVRDAPGRGCVEASLERVRAAHCKQQEGVPDQTALVWRIDLMRLTGELIWRTAGHQRFSAVLHQKYALEGKVAELEETLLKYKVAMDAIYNHNEAARAAVIAHFGIHHEGGAPESNMDSPAS